MQASEDPFVNTGVSGAAAVGGFPVVNYKYVSIAPRIVYY